MRQVIDNGRVMANILTLGGLALDPDFAGGGHGIEDGRHYLRGPGARHLVGHLRLEQLRVGQDDPELIVQAVEQQAEVWRFVHGRSRTSRIGGWAHEASLLVSSCVRPGSRQSVSTKMRTDPPAVRTYSTLPLAIQL
jgi:hypothetical protein